MSDLSTNEHDKGRTYKILIVDDEKDILLALHTTLKRARQFSSEISIASNGKEALLELEHKEFDVVISDYKMPGMNGLEFLTTVKKNYPNIIRILITACTDINVAKDAINKVAVDYYIEKPWDNKELSGLIYLALKRKDKDNVKQTKKDDIKDQELPLSFLPVMSDKKEK